MSKTCIVQTTLELCIDDVIVDDETKNSFENALLYNDKEEISEILETIGMRNLITSLGMLVKSGIISKDRSITTLDNIRVMMTYHMLVENVPDACELSNVLTSQLCKIHKSARNQILSLVVVDEDREESFCMYLKDGVKAFIGGE